MIPDGSHTYYRTVNSWSFSSYDKLMNAGLISWLCKEEVSFNRQEPYPVCSLESVFPQDKKLKNQLKLKGQNLIPKRQNVCTSLKNETKGTLACRTRHKCTFNSSLQGLKRDKVDRCWQKFNSAIIVIVIVAHLGHNDYQWTPNATNIFLLDPGKPGVRTPDA